MAGEVTAVLDLLVVGAGPCGLACALEAERTGLDYVVLEKGCICYTIYRMPLQMTFFSTPDLLAIGGVPFVIAGEKPTRHEALQYYRGVTAAFRLRVRPYEEVTRVEPAAEGGFVVWTRSASGREGTWRTRNLVMATGYFDHPNFLGVPGEDLPKVSHYYREGHPWYDRDVLVVGGNNSAVEAALDLARCGARVTLVHRGPGLGEKVKPWVRPVAESAIRKGTIAARFETVVERIEPEAVVVRGPGGSERLPNDAVFAMTGYRPDHSFLRALGVRIDPESGEPVHDPETMETEVPGLFIAGVLAAGYDANKIFIENGRFHGERIVRCVTARRGAGGGGTRCASART
ncbi:MAG: YpdA family putative bacillithiol disulfide reductase [Clostridia bacterium]|nr:YpdA family putative bacillithiol disulfide reductase [Clostridia bacterium]